MGSSSEIHRQLGHPVIDIDGHMAEHLPTLAPYLEQEGLSLDHPSFRRPGGSVVERPGRPHHRPGHRPLPRAPL
jgi:hypothetical protein